MGNWREFQKGPGAKRARVQVGVRLRWTCVCVGWMVGVCVGGKGIVFWVMSVGGCLWACVKSGTLVDASHTYTNIHAGVQDGGERGGGQEARAAQQGGVAKELEVIVDGLGVVWCCVGFGWVVWKG